MLRLLILNSTNFDDRYVLLCATMRSPNVNKSIVIYWVDAGDVFHLAVADMESVDLSQSHHHRVTFSVGPVLSFQIK